MALAGAIQEIGLVYASGERESMVFADTDPPTPDDLSLYLNTFATTLIERIKIGIEEHSDQVSYLSGPSTWLG